MYWKQVSAVTAFVAAVGAFVLTTGLRRATYSALAPAGIDLAASQQASAGLFSESLYQPTVEASGFAIALCIYASGAALFNRSNYTAAALLASAAALFAWKRIAAPRHSLDTAHEYKRAALRLASVFLPALLMTFWALLDGVAHRDQPGASNPALTLSEGRTQTAKFGKPPAQQASNSTLGASGYESIILWPVPEKKQIIPPLPAPSNLLAPGTTKPLVIRFDAPYWYFQRPSNRPGPRAHQAHGTPLLADIQARNLIPLIMEAHQNLGTSIPVPRCREIDVTILNRDNRRGTLNLALLLSNSAAPSRPALYLGQQPVVTSQPGHFTVKAAALSETLRFPVPQPAKMRNFDEITVMFLPDDANFDIGPKLAIQDFQLLPR